MSNVFIIYSAADEVAQTTIRSYLQQTGFSLDDRLETADSVIYAVTSSTFSEASSQHLQQALTYQKRIIPLVFELSALIGVWPRLLQNPAMGL